MTAERPPIDTPGAQAAETSELSQLGVRRDPHLIASQADLDLEDLLEQSRANPDGRIEVRKFDDAQAREPSVVLFIENGAITRQTADS